MKSKTAVRLLAAGLVAAGVVAADSKPSVAGMFDGVEVRVASFGGKWRKLIESTVGEAFAKEGGKMIYVAGSPSPELRQADRLTRSRTALRSHGDDGRFPAAAAGQRYAG